MSNIKGSFSVWLDRNILLDSKENIDSAFLNVQNVSRMWIKLCRKGIGKSFSETWASIMKTTVTLQFFLHVKM